MAAAMISSPGTQYGPCAGLMCAHTDCAEMRHTADAFCRICGARIGYDRCYYRRDDGFEHAACAEDQRAK